MANKLIGLAALSADIAAKDGITFEGFSTIHRPDMPIIVLPVEGPYALSLQLDWDTGNIT